MSAHALPAGAAIAVDQFVQDSEANDFVTSMVADVTDHLVASALPRPVAIALTGSFARGEGSVILTENGMRVLGDMEFMVFYRGRPSSKLHAQLSVKADEISRQLAEARMACTVEFSPASVRYLARLQPQIFGYELLSHGRVVWGDTNILQAGRRFPVSAIPLWDAWRMVNNRLIEQLECMDGLANGNRAELEKAFYAVVKLYLDMATTILLFGRRYRSTYAERARELSRWAGEKSDPAFLRPVAAAVGECTEFKLRPSECRSVLGARLDGDTEELRQAITKVYFDVLPLAHEVWRWETLQLLGDSSDHCATDSELLEQVLRRQAWAEKLRGWAKVLLIKAQRHTPAFKTRLRRFETGSPRYLLYSVASQLYFGSGALLAGQTPDLRPLDALLPVVFETHGDQAQAWFRVREQVLTGWKLFLRNAWA